MCRVFPCRSEGVVDRRWRKMLLGVNASGGAVILWPIRFHCVEIWISAGLPYMFICNWPYVFFLPTCAKLDLALALRNVTVAYVGKCLYAHAYYMYFGFIKNSSSSVCIHVIVWCIFLFKLKRIYYILLHMNLTKLLLSPYIIKLLTIVINTNCVLCEVRTGIWCGSDEFQSLKCQMMYDRSFDKSPVSAVARFYLIFFP